MPERLTTFDHVTLVADWIPAPTTLGAVILLHMMPATRQSWAPFQRVLAERGLASLAIDLRGHGESTQADGGTLAYQKFTDAQHARSINDVRAAYEWIRAKGIEATRIGLAGASIGANLALQFLAEEPQIVGAILLSPGLQYHGVSTPDAAEKILPHQGVWMAASRGDDDESVNAIQQLAPLLAVEDHVTKIVDNHGHGTKMFEADPALMAEAADWMRARTLALAV
jgi:alpha-beta hydrolase superfamily lysophospholipase